MNISNTLVENRISQFRHFYFVVAKIGQIIAIIFLIYRGKNYLQRKKLYRYLEDCVCVYLKM